MPTLNTQLGFACGFCPCVVFFSTPLSSLPLSFSLPPPTFLKPHLRTCHLEKGSYMYILGHNDPCLFGLCSPASPGTRLLKPLGQASFCLLTGARGWRLLESLQWGTNPMIRGLETSAPQLRSETEDRLNPVAMDGQRSCLCADPEPFPKCWEGGAWGGQGTLRSPLYLALRSRPSV